MVKDRKEHPFPVDLESLKRINGTEKDSPLPLFRHQGLLETIQTAPVIRGKELLNALHYIHFTNNAIQVHVSDPHYNEGFFAEAFIDHCLPDEIVCRWPEVSPALPESAKIPHLIVSDGLSLILLPLRMTKLDEEGFTAFLPEQGYLLGKRRVRRYPCRDIGVSLTQSGFLARGELVDFSPQAFRVRLTPDAGGSFIWLNKDSRITISMAVQERFLFSGPCRCVRQTGNMYEKELVLAPLEQGIYRFEKRKTRNRRIRVMPPPSAYFEHPFFRKPIQRDICNLTVAGLAVEEQAEESTLLPGMIIPGLEIRYAETLKLTCDTQVIYRQPLRKGRVRCGMAILNMDFPTYVRLGHIIAHTEDPRAFFSGKVEMDALWEFFFNSGFIYPKKYHLLQDRREEFKQTYTKLYQESPEIAAHFTLAQNGRIYGHVSMIRAYQRAWMIHHLAARTLNGKRAGLVVLKHILRFFEGLYRYPAIRMDHMIFFFRPENRFPNLFFGNFAREINNPKLCSLDLFAYLNHPTDTPQIPLPKGWQLADFSPRHLPELERYYRNVSGGLFLDILRLDRREDEEEPLEEVYQRHGFFRQQRVYALTREETIKAVLIDDRSNLGMNLSDLLNCIKIIVTDPPSLPWDVLTAALSSLTTGLPAKTVPLMVYPASYPADQNREVDKQYLLWIMPAEHGKLYREYMENKTRMALRFLFKHLFRKLVG